MWQTHSARNRTILGIFGVLLVAAGVLGILVAAGLLPGMVDRVPNPVAPLADAGTRGIAGVLAIGFILVVVAVFLLLSVLPRRPRARTMRYEGEDGALTSLDSEVVSRAAAESALRHDLVTDAQVRVGGTTHAPVLRARYTVRQDAPIRDSLGLISEVLIPEVEGVLGGSFEAVHVRVEVSTARAGTSQEVDLADLG